MKRINLLLAVLILLFTNIAAAEEQPAGERKWKVDFSMGGGSNFPRFKIADKVVSDWESPLGERGQALRAIGKRSVIYSDSIHYPSLSVGEVFIRSELSLISPERKWKIGAGVDYWQDQGRYEKWNYKFFDATTASVVTTEDSVDYKGSIITGSLFVQRNLYIFRQLNYFLGFGGVYCQPDLKGEMKFSTKTTSFSSEQCVMEKWILYGNSPVAGYLAKTGFDFSISRRAKIGIELRYLLAEKSQGFLVNEYSEVNQGIQIFKRSEQRKIGIDSSGASVSVKVGF